MIHATHLATSVPTTCGVRAHRAVLALAAALGVPAALRAQAPPASPPPTTGRAIFEQNDATVLQLAPDGRTVFVVGRDSGRAGALRAARYDIVGDSAYVPRGAWTLLASEARWAPDGRRLAYVAGGRVWVADVDEAAPPPAGRGAGGLPNAKALTQPSRGGAAGLVWAPAGDRVAFVARARAGSPRHLYVADATGATPPRDVTPATTADVAPSGPGEPGGYAFAPDGRELAYAAGGRVYTIALGPKGDPGAAPPPEALLPTSAAGAESAQPAYAADGSTLFYLTRRQSRATGKSAAAAAWRLVAYDRATRAATPLLPGWESSVDAYAVALGGAALIVQANEAGRARLYLLRRVNGVWGVAPKLASTVHPNYTFRVPDGSHPGQDKPFDWPFTYFDRLGPAVSGDGTRVAFISNSNIPVGRGGTRFWLVATVPAEKDEELQIIRVGGVQF